MAVFFAERPAREAVRDLDGAELGGAAENLVPL